MSEERARADLEAIHAEAVAGGCIEPVGDPESLRFWRACDLASLIEGCFHVEKHPATLDEQADQPWIERLRGWHVIHPLDAPDDDDPWERRYWLLDEGTRAGTVKLSVSPYGGPWLSVHSLYVLPERRGRRIARNALNDLAAAAVRRGLAGLELGTGWTWQKSLRFYLGLGFWIRSWKHDIQLVLEPGLPKWRFAIEANAATFDVLEDGERRRLLTAQRDDDRLMLEVAQAFDERGPDELGHLAVGTFAMLLALAEWPLVRSEAEWAARYSWSDAGEPEGLAYKIGVFEEVAREYGWSIETPRIPGLDRWQAWARGEAHGRKKEMLRAIEVVLRERELGFDEARAKTLADLHPYWELETLLRRAATAASAEEWWVSVEEIRAKRPPRAKS